MEIPSKPASKSVRYLIRSLYQLRSSVQKFEFATLWIILIHAAIFQKPSTLSVLYTKVSFVSRLAAYCIDFANANEKYNQNPNTMTPPLWLLFHHSGVVGMHLFSAFFLAPKKPIEIFVWALCSQSSHNTWTKKLSLSLYWGNVLLGVLSGSYSANFLYDGGSQYPAMLFLASLVVAIVGIGLLVLEQLNPGRARKSLILETAVVFREGTKI